MDGPKGKSSSSRRNAGLLWINEALEIVHKAMKGETELKDLPTFESFPNYDSADAESKQLIQNTHCRLRTLQAKGNSYETELRDLGGRSSADEKEVMRVINSLNDYSKREVQHWPMKLEYRSSAVSKNAQKCLQAMENMYLFARKHALLSHKYRQQDQQANYDGTLPHTVGTETPRESLANGPSQSQQQSADQPQAKKRPSTTANTTRNTSESQTDSKLLAKELQRCQSRVSKLTDEVAKANLEANENKSRLSECLGAKLSDNNANIADLSDPNRPTKLAETYSQIYDNEWTDAFSHQVGILHKTERQAIERLLDILKDANGYCVEQSKAYRDRALAVMTLSEDTTADDHDGKFGGQSEKTPPLTLESLVPTQRRTFHDLLRQLSETSSVKIAKKYIVQLTKEGTYTYKEITSCKTYIEKCCELCWYMNLQTPPVYVDFQSKDLKEYRFYTKQGSQMDFVVWPPLKIHIDGPMLYKGVAQGCE